MREILRPPQRTQHNGYSTQPETVSLRARRQQALWENGRLFCWYEFGAADGTLEPLEAQDAKQHPQTSSRVFDERLEWCVSVSPVALQIRHVLQQETQRINSWVPLQDLATQSGPSSLGFRTLSVDDGVASTPAGLTWASTGH